MSLIQLSIALVVNHPTVTSAGIADHTEQLEGQMSAGDISLDDVTPRRIDKIVRPGVDLDLADTSHGEHVFDSALRRR